MQTVDDYLDRTESAVRLLFDGIKDYISILRTSAGVTFVTSEPYGPKQDAEYAAWKAKNAKRLLAAREAEQRYLAESFALDTLSGSVLQVAAKAIEIYGKSHPIPETFKGIVKPKLSKFCDGRDVRTVPLGLIIYAARNQHTHFNEGKLREPSAAVFKRLATEHGYGGQQQIFDPAFDIDNPRLVSLATNVTGLIEWRAYESYLGDMHALLQT
ncbi:hypothetical protein BTW08_00925 [Salinicola sp. MH3R3-1]|uniref:hypothetical protein n=1 Tax=Salinicola sp. MH3R3-1 TaxID=1928762 RepID=UPI00094E0C0B|nr:hypothetical protein [Salinicola sp. MH3R3-1]OLO09681.1 hypothetical protein BTW08_00925 [Salinicola sp. MH3R3-1]